MAERHVISALVKKRGELGWLLSEAGKLQRRIAKHIAHVDHSLAIMGYRDDPQTIRRRRKNNPSLFRRGQLRRMIYDICREGPCITTDPQFAFEVMKRLGWDTGNDRLLLAVALKVRDVRKAIGI